MVTKEETRDGSLTPVYTGMLKAWQLLEMIGIVAVYAGTFMMVAFSGNEDLLYLWSILWKVLLIKIVIYIFFLKKHKWAVLLNMVQWGVMTLLSGYAIYYLFVYGEKKEIVSFIVVFLLLIGIIYWFYFLTRRSYEYYQFLREQKTE